MRLKLFGTLITFLAFIPLAQAGVCRGTYDRLIQDDSNTFWGDGGMVRAFDINLGWTGLVSVAVGGPGATASAAVALPSAVTSEAGYQSHSSKIKNQYARVRDLLTEAELGDGILLDQFVHSLDLSALSDRSTQSIAELLMKLDRTGVLCKNGNAQSIKDLVAWRDLKRFVETRIETSSATH